MTTPSPQTMPLLFFFIFFIFITLTRAKIVTFTYVNAGPFSEYPVEYNANFRYIPVVSEGNFQLTFYNTTTGKFHVGLLLGIFRTENIRPRWVWEANRGRPVGEKATLSLLTDGNLVLAEADGSVVWSTSTANKGVVGLKILPNGNMVLYDSRGRFAWQSFDHPTDTLLVGQSLRAKGPRKLVSRRSAIDGSFGIYSFVMGSQGFTMYIHNTVPYFNYSDGMWGFSVGPFISATLECNPETAEAAAYDLRLAVATDMGSGTPNVAPIDLARPKYNATLSFLRLEPNGNLVAYIYYDPVEYQAWEQAFTFFSIKKPRVSVSECALPSKCGALGVCDDGMCVGCPTSQGRMEWSKKCRLPETPACDGQKVAVDYYKVEGVENFISSYAKGEEGVKMDECKRRCGMDCKCVGFMYWEMESKCWLAPMIGTLAKVSNSSHVAYIKL